jgi:hypothetical protein
MVVIQTCITYPAFFFNPSAALEFEDNISQMFRQTLYPLDNMPSPFHSTVRERDRILLSCPGCTGTWNPPASASRVLGL